VSFFNESTTLLASPQIFDSGGLKLG
jgi:hypothetical protein